MTRETSNQTSGIDDLVAELTDAVYPIALKSNSDEHWMELELDLWRAMEQTVKKWQQRAFPPL